MQALKQQVIGEVTREDHGDIANAQIRLYLICVQTGYVCVNLLGFMQICLGESLREWLHAELMALKSAKLH